MQNLLHIVTGFGPKRSSLIAAILALVTIVSILLLMANIGNITDEEGEGILGPSGNIIAGRVAEVLFVVWIVLFISFLLIKFKGRREVKAEDEEGGGSAWAWPVGILALIAFIVVVKLISDGFSQPVDGDGGGGGGGGEIIPGTGEGGTESYFIYIITLVIIAVLVYVIVKELWSRRTPPLMAGSKQDIKVIIDEAVDSLESGRDPRTVIYRSYLRMCKLLERRGLTDISYMTPGEFAAVAVREFHLPADKVEELTYLFEEARYSDHPVGESMKERSIRCLDSIRRSIELEKGASPGPLQVP